MKKLVLTVSCFVLCAFSAFAELPKPLLVPDYDRDGTIGATDREKALASKEFTIWINDDDDAEGTGGGEDPGDTNNDLHDVPGGEGNDRDCEDEQVNGRCDLLDFFPVLIDMKGMEGSEEYTWKLSSKSVNVVFTQLKADTAGSFHTQEVKALDGDTPLYRAGVEKLVGEDSEKEVELPKEFLVKGQGVIIVEGAALGDEGLTLRGEKEGSDPVVVTLDLRVKNVEDMYRWMNLRPKQEDESRLDEPSARPDSESDGRHFVLVHGYNSNHEEARGNAAEFYKKLWQSGSDAMMTAVEWQGDQSQIKIPIVELTVTPNYFVNVENAFLAARPFADACKKLPGEKILVGHSLGNALISSAIKDYGLDYTKFVMLNAAVPREAYDAGAYDEDMVDDDWQDAKEVPFVERASQWYKNFAGKEYDPYEYRRKLAWRGRFANLPRTVNYYSPTDNVLLNPDPNEPDPDDYPEDKVYEEYYARLVGTANQKQKTGFGFWSFSEKMKGTWVVDAINEVLTNLAGFAASDAMKCEAGWGTNENYKVKAEFDPANTRFTPFLDPRMKTKGMLDILPAETERLRAQHLADAIPSESFAAGANEVATLANVNMESFIDDTKDHRWPVYEGEDEPGAYTNEWKHSTFREVAFYHTSKLYTSLAAVGKTRIIIDTDLGSSMDDLFTVDLAARMHREGKLDLMGVMMDRPDYSDDKAFRGEFLAFADRYLASLGLGDLPIGKAEGQSKQGHTIFNPYWTLIYSNNLTGVGLLLPTNRTPEQISAFTNAVALYRQLLEGAPDKSVVICSTGFLTNLRALMDSDSDLALIAKKVKELRIMGGCFDYTDAPDGTGGAEYNFAGDPEAAKKVVEGWPTPVILSPWEVGLKLEYQPKDVLADFPAGTFDPVVRSAYTYWPEPLDEKHRNRLWDPMTVLPLTEGDMLVPLSELGGISVDGSTGKTTFEPDASSNRCYQISSNMNATAVMNRIRAICRTGNPALPDAVRCIKDAGIDYNGHDLTFKVPKFSLGAYGPNDVHMVFAFDDKSYVPDEVTYDPVLEVFSVHFSVPKEDATAWNFYNGTLTITLENETIGATVIKDVPTQIVQGAIDRGVSTGWFDETELEVPTNYVPTEVGKGQMPERNTVSVETTFRFEEPSPATYDPPEGAAQAAVRVVEDGLGGYKFQYYAFAGLEDGKYYRTWHDFNVGGEKVHEIKPEIGQTYIVRMEGFYDEDARGEENTLALSVMQEGSNEGFVPQFVGNIVNKNGGIGGTTQLNSVGLAGEGTVFELKGEYYQNVVNANLARVDGTEYATVAQAVAAAGNQDVRLLYKASWKPTAADVGKPVKFLNKSWLNLDLSGLPSGTRAVWTNVDGNNGTLTVYGPVLADTVVYGTIRTADKENGSVAEAIAIKDGKFVYVGDEAGVAAFVKDGVTKVIDHRGKGMVMPGCTDGHSHYTMKFGIESMKGGILFDLNDDKTKVLEKVEAAARTAKDAGKTCILGFGWNLANLRVKDTTPLTLKEFDDITYGLSMVIFAHGGHHAYCNSECLKRCKILSEDGKTVLITKIDGGLLELDENGYPTGFVDERVTGYLMRMGGINYDEIVDDEVAEASIRASQELLLSTGYTTSLEGWSNTLHPSNFYVAAHRMDTNGTLKLVFPMTYEVEPWQTNMTEQIDYLDSLNKTYRTRHVLPEYLKVFMDGCVESMTGAMLKPYKDKDKTVYKSFWPTNRLADITRECNAKGLTVHTHVMGDAAIKEVTDAYVKANELSGDSAYRNCLVHLRHVRKEDFQRFAKNNIACSAGFTWHVSIKEVDDLLKNFLDEDYIKHAYPMKSFFDAGVKVSSHSDYPANAPSPQDPFGIIQVAVTGLLPNSSGEEPFDTDELVTVEQVFQALTLNGAWQMGLENERGSIQVGKWADFVLADQDVFVCEKTDIAKTKVVSTWFEGEKVYQAPLPGSEKNPWRIGATTNDTVTAWTNGTDKLVIEGKGAMKDFETVGPWGTGIAAAEFGAQVTNVGANAFSGCEVLKALTMRGNPPAIGSGNDFSGVTLTVRADAKAKFEAADGWKDCAIGTVIPVCYDYEHMKTLTPFLHEVWYDDYVFDKDGETLSKDMVFSCSAVRNGNFIGRNFDFFLNDTPEFVVHVAANPSKGRLASVGMAMHSGMREDGVTNGEYTASYDIIPNRTVDGINEKGVAINQNVVAYDPEVVAGAGKEFTGTNPGAPDLNISFVTRMVLDNATNAAHAVDLIKSHNLFGMSVSGDILHYMISDSNETYVVEIITNTVVARHFKMMTNFNVNWDNGNARALTDADKEVWTKDYYPEPTNLVIAAGNFDDATNALACYYALHAEGVERFIRLRDNYDEGKTFDGMVNLMKLAQYSQASTFDTQPYWYSDRCSVALDKALIEAGIPALANTYVLYGLKYYPSKTGMVGFSLDAFLERELMKNERTYLENKDFYRKKDTGVWLTVHNTTYDIEKRMFRVAVQEDYDHTFDIYLADRPVEPVTPGRPLGPYDTAEEATNVAKKAVLTPSQEVETKLGKESDALRTYCNMFAFDVVPAAGGKWAVAAFLLPTDWTNVIESAQAATLQLPVADLAALGLGDVLNNVKLTNCVPGFFYSLYDGAAVTNIRAVQVEEDLNVLCGTDKEVLFPNVTKPIGGQNSGFFSIGVLEVPDVLAGAETYHTITGFHANTPSHH